MLRAAAVFLLLCCSVAAAQTVCLASVCVDPTPEPDPSPEPSGPDPADPAPADPAPAEPSDPSASTGPATDPAGPSQAAPPTEPADPTPSNAVQSSRGTLAWLVSAMGTMAVLAAAMVPWQTAALPTARRLATWLAAPALLLFSRIHGDAVLHQPQRALIMQTVQAEPGIDVDHLRRRVGIAWSTARHHLDHLERHGLVRSVRAGPHRLYYPEGTQGARDRHDLAVLQSGSRRRVAAAILHRPGTTNAALARELGLSRPAISHHLKALVAAGLVEAHRTGRQHVLMPGARLDRLVAACVPVVHAAGPPVPAVTMPSQRAGLMAAS